MLKIKWEKSTDIHAEFHWNQSEGLSNETRSLCLGRDSLCKSGFRLSRGLGRDSLCKSSGRKNVLRKLLRILYRRLKAGFSVCWSVLTIQFVCLSLREFWLRLNEMHKVWTFASRKAFLLLCGFCFLLLENYFRLGTTNVKGKTDHSVSLRWNKEFWTFPKRRVFFWLFIRFIHRRPRRSMCHWMNILISTWTN